jgi:hypothetical protein
VSSISSNNCWVGGDYNNGVSQAFAADEVHGVWHQAFSPPGTYTNFSGGLRDHLDIVYRRLLRRWRLLRGQ